MKVSFVRFLEESTRHHNLLVRFTDFCTVECPNETAVNASVFPAILYNNQKPNFILIFSFCLAIVKVPNKMYILVHFCFWILSRHLHKSYGHSGIIT